MKMLAIYDVAHPRRLSRVAKIMLDYGFRVQKSKFEIDPTPYGFKVLKERMAKVINPEEDGIKYIPLCQSCGSKIEIIGQGIYLDPDEEYYII